jgi:hypothetical protein
VILPWKKKTSGSSKLDMGKEELEEEKVKRVAFGRKI